MTGRLRCPGRPCSLAPVRRYTLTNLWSHACRQSDEVRSEWAQQAQVGAAVIINNHIIELRMSVSHWRALTWHNQAPGRRTHAAQKTDATSASQLLGYGEASQRQPPQGNDFNARRHDLRGLRERQHLPLLPRQGRCLLSVEVSDFHVAV